MKNYRGTALANIKQAIFSVYENEQLPKLATNTTTKAITIWKKNLKVKQCHRLLFELNDNGDYWSFLIAREAFIVNSAEVLTNHHLAFTLAVCDIILNSISKGTQCTEKEMKKRIEYYLVCFNNILKAITGNDY